MSTKGLRQFLDAEQQRAWLEGEIELEDAAERTEHLEHRFKYAGRFEKLLKRAQAEDVLDILKLYGSTCLPIPRRTERYYWSVSCLPSTSDKPLVRVNASWMELFTLSAQAQRGDCEAIAKQRVESAKRGRPAAEPTGSTSREERQACDSMARATASDGGDSLRSRIILHLSDFTVDGSSEPDQLDTGLLESCALRPEDMSHSIWRDSRGILIAKVRGAASIRHFIQHPHGRRAIRNFNLSHMNRGRNAYQFSHCCSVADAMLGE